MQLEVVEPGWATQVVDLGRPHTRALGVAVGGAADRWSLTLGNALVGNPANAPALEISFKGPTLRAIGGDAGCVVFGAPFDVRIDDHPLRSGLSFTLHDGQSLHILGTREGVRCYLCVRGGIQSEPILNSRSGLEPLQKNQRLECLPSSIDRRFMRVDLAASWQDIGPIRVVAGLQADWFDASAAGTFYEQTFVVSTASNRQGLRLEGKPLALPGRELVSEPVCPGAVQVTSNGQCIVLGIDAQTIGGYPKIAQVIAADLDRLGQIRPGQQLTFEQVSLEQAAHLYRQNHEKLHEWAARARSSLDGLHWPRKL